MKRFFFIVAFVLPSIARAHAHLTSNNVVTPRDPGGASIKAGPCGNRPRVSAPPVLNAGQTITVNWTETINHPGRFEFYLSNGNDQNFVLLKTVPDTQDSGPTPHMYSTTLALPSTPCTGCTLQMIQVMTENPANPTNYYSCADLVIQATASSTPAPTLPIAPNVDCKTTSAGLTK